jgi:GTP pyrophosphokinase
VKSGEIQKLVKAGRFSSVDEMLIDFGYGRTDIKEFIERVFPPKVPELTLAQVVADKAKEDSSTPGGTPKSTDRPRASKSGILVSGIDDVLVAFAQCCNPLPGEAIMGFVTRGKGVTVHRASCARALDLDPVRRIDVQWAKDGVETSHTAFISVVAYDRPGVLADITQVMANVGANILKAQIRVAGDLKGTMDFEVSVKGLNQLKLLIGKLEALSSVLTVERRDSSKMS